MAPPMDIYRRLLEAYGPQVRWSTESPFEMMVGSILMQNSSASNVEKAVENLRGSGLMGMQVMAGCDPNLLAETIRPCSFFRQKSKRLQSLCEFLIKYGGVQGLRKWPASTLRNQLLNVHGIGPETADAILLYALEHPRFVVDTHTKRIFSRMGCFHHDLPYQDVQRWFQQRMANSLPIFQEYHALIFIHAKRHCRSKPDCGGCPLFEPCGTHGLE